MLNINELSWIAVENCVAFCQQRNKTLMDWFTFMNAVLVWNGLWLQWVGIVKWKIKDQSTWDADGILNGIYFMLNHFRDTANRSMRLDLKAKFSYRNTGCYKFVLDIKSSFPVFRSLLDTIFQQFSFVIRFGKFCENFHRSASKSVKFT